MHISISTPLRKNGAKSLLVSALMLLVSGQALANQIGMSDQAAGEIKAISSGKKISLPMLKSSYDVDIDGNLATVTLEQVFLNASDIPLNATYLFPLNQKAAIFSMKMEVGEETIQAIIQRKEKALKTFETAKKEGKAASLLVQHRPNMFTQNIANLMPQMPIKVTLQYVQQLPKIDEAYELVVPMIVGPRFEGALPTQLASNLGLSGADNNVSDDLMPEPKNEPAPTKNISGWNIAKLPEYPSVIGYDAPANIDQERVSFSMQLNSKTPISGLFSKTHQLDINAQEFEATAMFSAKHEIDNRDLVIRYELAKETQIAAGVSSTYDERGGFMSLLIEPPKIAAQEAITPRELVFVLDTSGSMTGQPMDASKTFMQAALSNMRPSDYFRVLRFSNNTSQFAQGAVAATPANIRKASRFIAGLSAGGGTEMNAAINAAFDLQPVANTMRIVVFLTDGYIGRDRQVIQTVSKRIGDARIYSFGVGDAPNRFLLEGLAKEGRGRARYIEIGEDSEEVAQALAANLDTPLLTDISIDWNGLEISQATPSRIPDLFAGTSINVLARYKTGGEHEIILKGHVNGRPASMPLTIDLAKATTIEQTAGNTAIPLIWAREQIFDKNREFIIDGGVSEKLKEEITQLGLDYSLQSPFTSFVAVSKVAYNEKPDEANTSAVPLPKVSGVAKNAYPSLNLSGSSTPEPAAYFGIFAVLMLLIVRFKKNISKLFLKRRPAPGNKVPTRLAKDGWWLE